MKKFSARNLYLLLSFCITLLFAGTGIYYLFTNDSSDQLEKVTTQEIAQENSTPTPKPESTPSPIPTPKLESTPIPTASPTPKPELKQDLETFMQDLDLSCYETCEYNYQCPANLECMQIDETETKVCANSKCKLDSTCTCQPDAQNITQKDELNIGGLNENGSVAGLENNLNEEDDSFDEFPEEDFDDYHVGGEPLSQNLNEPDPTVTPKPTTTPQAKIADLPKAGTIELTIALLLIGLSVISIGFAYLK